MTEFEDCGSSKAKHQANQQSEAFQLVSEADLSFTFRAMYNIRPRRREEDKIAVKSFI